MSPYNRAKKEDYIEPTRQVMQVRVGSPYDDFETLEEKCNNKSNELLKIVSLKEGEEIEVEFWTSGCPELICVSKISKSETGFVSYHLDFSESTL